MTQRPYRDVPDAIVVHYGVGAWTGCGMWIGGALWVCVLFWLFLIVGFPSYEGWVVLAIALASAGFAWVLANAWRDTQIVVDRAAGILVIRSRRWRTRITKTERTVRLSDILSVEIAELVQPGWSGFVEGPPYVVPKRLRDFGHSYIVALRLVGGELLPLEGDPSEEAGHHQEVAERLRAALKGPPAS